MGILLDFLKSISESISTKFFFVNFRFSPYAFFGILRLFEGNIIVPKYPIIALS